MACEGYENFARSLKETGSYQSPRTGKTRGKSSLNSLFFYLKCARTIIGDSLVAKQQGGYRDEQWGQTSYDIFKAAESRGGVFDIKGVSDSKFKSLPINWSGRGPK